MNKFRREHPLEYQRVHQWIRRVGEKKQCEHCGDGGTLHWSNISGEYRYERDDWQVLCAMCHRSYDLNVQRIDTNPRKYQYRKWGVIDGYRSDGEEACLARLKTYPWFKGL